MLCVYTCAFPTTTSHTTVECTVRKDFDLLSNYHIFPLLIGLLYRLTTHGLQLSTATQVLCSFDVFVL